MNALRTTLRGLGQTLITAGIVILLFVAYELWFTGFYTAREQSKLYKQFVAQLTKPLPGGLASVPFGNGIAVLRIPRLGADYRKVVVQGVATADLKKGPGHYPGSAYPGQLGNFVVSGHRTTYGAPFNRLDELHRGDAIVVETHSRWFTYREVSQIVVDPDASWVLGAVPCAPGATCAFGQPGGPPTKRLLTFTTCNPKYSASQRLIVFARLATSQPRTSGLPAALQAEAS